jgi:sterol desaturase/sphingolipid hydroxylase (fatty acid hydroxylase superfamily)
VAVCAAWLFLWPYQLPWYDAMIICVLVLYPASRLDWLVLARLTAGTISNMPGNPYLQHSHLLRVADHFAVRTAAPVVMLAAAVALVALCVTGRWNVRDAPGPERTVPGGAGLAPAAGPPA